ncbi:MAG: hypothetical protein KF799_10655 [Bdellovibrionales bacterium]|nr:hypothetical protein [Bdellovibrionales bacterium]
MRPLPCKKAAAARRVWAVALSFFLGFPPQARSESETLQTLALLRNGVPATLHDKTYLQSRQQLLNRTEAFAEAWSTAMTNNPSQRCQRFSTTVADLLVELKDSLANLQTADVGARARFHLITSAIFAVHSLFVSGGEGGYSSLDHRDLTKCPFTNRQETAQSFADLARELSHFHLKGIGNPGLAGFDHMVTDLLKTAQTELESRQRVSLTLIGAATLASIFLWQVAPPLAAKILGSSALAIGPWAAFGARSVAFAAESVTYQFAEAKLNPSPPERQTNITSSWTEQMRDIELLSQHSREPQVQIVFLIQVQAQMVQLFRPWLDKHREELLAIPGNDTIALAKEAFEFSNAHLAQIPARLSELIRTDYGYHVGCDDSFWTGLSDLQCIDGLRSFARALYNGSITRLEGRESSLLQIHLVQGDLPQIHYGEWNAMVQLPYIFTPVRMYEFVMPILLNPSFHRLATGVEHFEAYKENIHLNTGLIMEFDPSLSIGQRWHSLRQLEILMRQSPATFDRATEVLRVGADFEELSESGMKLRESIPARADWKEIKAFLDWSAAEANDTGTLADIQSERRQVAELQETLLARIEVPIQCSPFATLNSKKCRQGLQRLSEFIRRHPDIKIRARGILIVAPGESPSRWYESKEDPHIIKIRTDFGFASLDSFGQTKGWYP